MRIHIYVCVLCKHFFVCKFGLLRRVFINLEFWTNLNVFELGIAHVFDGTFFSRYDGPIKVQQVLFRIYYGIHFSL